MPLTLLALIPETRVSHFSRDLVVVKYIISLLLEIRSSTVYVDPYVMDVFRCSKVVIRPVCVWCHLLLVLSTSGLPAIGDHDCWHLYAVPVLCLKGLNSVMCYKGIVNFSFSFCTGSTLKLYLLISMSL